METSNQFFSPEFQLNNLFDQINNQLPNDKLKKINEILNSSLATEMLLRHTGFFKAMGSLGETIKGKLGELADKVPDGVRSLLPNGVTDDDLQQVRQALQGPSQEGTEMTDPTTWRNTQPDGPPEPEAPTSEPAIRPQAPFDDAPSLEDVLNNPAFRRPAEAGDPMNIPEGGGQILDEAGNVMGGAADEAAQGVQQMADAAGEAVGNAAQQAASAVVEAVGNATQGVQQAASAVGQTVGQVGEAVGDAVGQASAAVGNAINTAAEIGGRVASAVGDATKTIGDVAAAAAEIPEVGPLIEGGLAVASIVTGFVSLFEKAPHITPTFYGEQDGL